MKFISLILLIICVSGCANVTALLSGGRIVKIQCPVLNPITGNLAITPNGKTVMSTYKFTTGGASKEFEAEAPGCLKIGSIESVQGEDRISSVAAVVGAVVPEE